jgi:GH25 family lysozyme M1 (1,4-beta-N-acetylmuramidase)
VLKVEYISILAQAQKLVGVVGQDRFLQSAAMLAEQFPEVKFKIDTNRVINNYADMLGVDPSIVRSDEDADAMREQAAQAVQQQAESEQMVNAAKAAKDASQAPLTGDSVLNRLVSGTNQPGAIAAPPTG